MDLQRLNRKIASLIAMTLFTPILFAMPGASAGETKANSIDAARIVEEKSSDETLSLTPQQRTWLKAHPVIRLAPDIAWPPFEWVNDQKQYQGIAADYMRLIENKLGVRFEVEKDKPWPDMIEAVKKRELDVFSCVAKNPQRLEYVNFTRPYLSFPMVMVTSDEVNYIDGIKYLTGNLVGVVKGYATHEYLKANHPEIELHLVKTSEEGLTAVSQGQIDVFIDNIATASTLMQKKGLTNLKISGEMPIRYELGMAVRKDWPELVEILQHALDSISDEDRKQIHNKWIGIRYEHGFDYGLFWKSLTAFIFIVGFLYFYNRKLAREINQRKVAEMEATQARDEANRANQAKSEFLSVVSHELRTPLTSIKGALGLLSSGVTMENPESAQNMLRIAYNNSERLSLLVDDILDIEKLLDGKMVFQKDVVEVSELISKAVTANQGYADQYGVHFSVEENKCGACTVIGDENRLLQVLSNLMSNAVKYSPAGACVLITTQCNEHKVRVAVTDQGEGVPAEFREHIFTRFSQADASNTRKRGGTGLGLAISREIIQRHGGKIGFDSPPGQGASFYFELDIN
ncbi:ATP-binding protein [Sulfuriflexus mobilis]|uniref:ATP-binding protein n=1 Tax=Sulfuriflexus mobilis TaxID=1811807 RepID=UPI000F823FC4|nr:transporter substrate-binding domain-containing protein [Sulfuriflexus mobilis]